MVSINRMVASAKMSVNSHGIRVDVHKYVIKGESLGCTLLKMSLKYRTQTGSLMISGHFNKTRRSERMKGDSS